MSGLVSDRITGAEASTAIKAPVKVASTANITLSGEQTIDGVAVTADDRVLVANQTDGIENGIYLCQTGAWIRAKDFNGARDIAQGLFVYVQSGTANANAIFALTTPDPVIGTSALDFSVTYNDGIGLTAGNILAALLTVDGAGSLLDSDKLDGQEAADFAPVSHAHAASDINAGTLDAARLPASTDSAIGGVETSTSAENITGTATGKYPDVVGVKEMLDTFAMGWNVLETQTASNSDELDFVLPSASLYAGVRFVLIDVLPNTDGDYLRLQTSTDGGSTFAATAGDYDYANVVLAAGGTVIASDNDNSFFAGIAHFIGTAAGEDGVNGAVEIYGANNAGKTKMTYQVSFLATSGKLRGEHGAAARMADGAVDAIRFTAGNNSTTNKISSGTIIMLGLRKA